MAYTEKDLGSVRSLNVSGPPREIEWRGRTLTTGIFKLPVEGPVSVIRHQVVGDVQADPRVHGGPAKAVYSYPAEHYDPWRGELAEPDLPYGAFGENLTTAGLMETEVQVGDVYRIGTVEIMATEPRMPCQKLAARFGRPDMQKLFATSGRSGIYFAVRTEGTLASGDRIVRVASGAGDLTIAQVVGLRTGRERNPEVFRRALDHPVLGDDWKETLSALAD